MIGCLDVSYAAARARAACLLLRDWSDDTAATELVRDFSIPGPYVPGAFYRRELPYLLGIVAELPDLPSFLVVDAYVWLDEHGRAGLGARLHQALGRRVPVIGVAKSLFKGAPAVAVTRGSSRLPLFISSAGISPEEAASHVAAMHGRFRVPTLLRLVDRLCRTSRTGA